MTYYKELPLRSGAIEVEHIIGDHIYLAVRDESPEQLETGDSCVYLEASEAEYLISLLQSAVAEALK